VLLFLFVPETFWDHTPRPRTRHSTTNNSCLSFRQRLASHVAQLSHYMHPRSSCIPPAHRIDRSGEAPIGKTPTSYSALDPRLRRPSQAHHPTGSLHVGFADEDHDRNEKVDSHDGHEGHFAPSNGHLNPLATFRMSPPESCLSGT
jgi:hypothetical protein